MEQTEFELHMAMKESFSSRICSATEKAIKFKFPDIDGLEVYMNDECTVTVLFNDKGNPTREMITSFLNNLKNT